ncbi:MAG: amidohydrolase [Planctomycetes bacterium]|nr:amidohydrolase [Planctomycetota bacterium]
MKITWCHGLAFVSALLAACPQDSVLAKLRKGPGRPASLVIVNAKLWSGLPEKESKEITTIAIGEGRIQRIGREADPSRKVNSGAQVIDAGGRRVIPGITDSHTHIIGGGLQLARLNLREVKSKEEFIRAVETDAKAKKQGEWVRGGRWSVESWARPESPRAEWLDSVTGETPIFLSRMDGHEALVNSVVLRMAGIDEKGPADPKGGEIERDPATHKPTGILKDAAMDLVERFIPPTSDEDRGVALVQAMRYANSLGVTSVQDMSNPEDIATFRKMAEWNALTVRITSYIQVFTGSASPHSDDVHDVKGASDDQWHSTLDQVANEKKFPYPMFRIAGYKLYMDGSLGSRTAYMREPFADAAPEAPHPRGQLTAFASSPNFLDDIALADAKGLQLAAHAIGDEANHLVLNAYEEAAKRNGGSGKRHRVEHAQHLLVSEIPRFKQLGVVASMQPYHKADDGRYAEKAIGRERLKGSYAFRQLLDAGALLIFGSDWPVVTMNPFLGVDSAVNARTLAGDVWLPEHSISIYEAFRAYCVSPQEAIGRDDLGTIEPGKLADLVILDDDPWTIPKERLGEVKVWKTIVDGKVVYSRE